MSIARSSLVRGPAKIVRGSGILYSQQPIPVNILRETLPIENDAYGVVDERDLETSVELTLIPEGRWDAATIAFLWPYASTIPGTSLFGSVDTPTVIHARDGALHTIAASAVTRMPNIFLSASRTMVGDLTITGLRANNTDWDDPNSLYTIATGATFADTGFSPSLIKVQPYTGVWGSPAVTGFGDIQTEDGWSIEFDLQLEPVRTDREGIIDMVFRSLSVMARCVPINPTPAQILGEMKVQNTGALRGRSLFAGGNDLVITGDDATTIATIKKAALKTAGYRFGATTLREGEIGFVATRGFTAGVPDALFTLAA